MAATLTPDVSVPTESGNTLTMRMWVPDGVTKLRGIIVACHPSGTGPPPAFQQDYRPLANTTTYWSETVTTEWDCAIRTDLALQLVARRHAFAFVGLYFSGQKPGGAGPGQVAMMPANVAGLEAGISKCATTFNHPELATAPIITFGFSGGSGFSAYYAAYNPSRCIAFGHNKGGSIADYDPVTMEAAEQVPAMLSYGEADTQTRIDSIKSTFAYHRAKGALWSLIPDYGLVHEAQGYGRFLAAAFFDHVIEMRLPRNWVPGTAPTLRPFAEDTGWLGDNTTWESGASTIVSYAASNADLPTKRTMSWMPDRYMAEAWRAVTTHLPPAKLSSPLSTLDTTKPKQLAYIANGGSQAMALSASGVAISSVDWQDGDVSVGTVTTPFSKTLSTLTPGIHLLHGQLQMSGGGTLTSDLAILLVNTPATNQTPMIVTGAAAASGPRPSGVPITCSVRAKDPDSSLEELLTYSWSMVSGPGTPVFDSANGTNAGKDLAITFPVAGSYVLKATVQDAVGASVSSTTSSITVQPAGSLSFSASSFSQSEGNTGTAATITVARSSGSTGAISVAYSTADGTALGGSDYVATSGTLSWADGDTANKSFVVNILGDTAYEPDETVALNLSVPTGGATLGAQSTATLLILNDDPAPQLYNSWASSNGLNGANALDTATPAGDGIPNLLKYALCLDPSRSCARPTDGSNPGLPLVVSDASDLGLIYQRDATKTDISYLVESGTDLRSWSGTGVTEQIIATNGTVQTVKASIPKISDPRKFIRLRIAR